MNKLTKAAIAGAAGIALLLGGAGSLAYWNDSASIGAATITAGHLTIDANGTGVWTDSGHANAVISDIATFRAVPGDSLTYTATFDVTAVGDNLTATVGVPASSIVAGNTANANDVALAAALTATQVIKVNGTAGVLVTPSSGAQTVTVAVTINWPIGLDGDGNSAMDGAVNLSGMTITLTQDH